MAAAADSTVQVLDKSGNPVSGAVVFIQEGGARPLDSVVVDQINKNFVPEITVVTVGTEVEFPNSDDISHHVYSFANPNDFELPLYKRGTTPRVRFEHPGIVVLGCNIHDSMVGYIVVIDASRFAVTDEDGRAAIPGGAISGQQALQVWSPRLDLSMPLAATFQPERSLEDQVFRVDKRQKLEPKPHQSSLAWEDY